MSLIFQKLIQARQSAVAKSETQKELVMKDEGCMAASANAATASNTAYQSSYNPAPPADDQVKAHMAAAKLHDAADKMHRAKGKEYMDSAPTVSNAHFQQAKQHFNSKQMHESNARSAMDDKDQGYRS